MHLVLKSIWGYDVCGLFEYCFSSMWKFAFLCRKILRKRSCLLWQRQIFVTRLYLVVGNYMRLPAWTFHGQQVKINYASLFVWKNVLILYNLTKELLKSFVIIYIHIISDNFDWKCELNFYKFLSYIFYQSLKTNNIQRSQWILLHIIYLKTFG